MGTHGKAVLATSALIVVTLTATEARQNPPLPDIDHITLKAAEVIEDVPCAAGDMWRFTDSGRLHRCTTDRDAVVRNAPLPKGSTVAFNDDGSHRYVFLPKTTVIEGHACRGAGHNFMTGFHANGRLKLCWLPDDATIQGVTCAGFSFWSDAIRRNPSGVTFHPNGQLKSCRLAKDAQVDGATVRKGTRITLDADGHVAKHDGP